MPDKPEQFMVADPVAEMEAFIFHPDQFTKDDVPLGLDPVAIAKFVTLRVNRLSSPTALNQTLKLVAFYDVNEVAKHFGDMLDRREKNEEDHVRSTYMTQIVATIGQPAEVENARKYYAFQVDGAQTVKVFDRLVMVYESLGPSTDAAPLSGKLDKKLSAARAQKNPDAGAVRDIQVVEKLVSRMQRAVKANDVKRKILEIPNRDQRLDEEVRMYLALKYGYGEFLPGWAAMRLRRETWAADPKQQTIRKVDAERSKEVVTSFRRILPSIDSTPNFTDEEKEFSQVSALLAISYFNGPLSPQERNLLAEKRGAQKVMLRPPD